MKLKARAGLIFLNCEKSNDGNPQVIKQVIKVPFKTNNSFTSTMMASFLPVIVSKTNKEKYAFHYSVWQIDINPEKTQKTFNVLC